MTYIISGLLAKPELGRGCLEVSGSIGQLQPGYIGMIIGLVGTTIAPWMQFYIQSAVVEKGVKLSEYNTRSWT